MTRVYRRTTTSTVRRLQGWKAGQQRAIERRYGGMYRFINVEWQRMVPSKLARWRDR